MSKPSWFKKNEALFLPEILPAAYFVLISPIWEIQLIGRGRVLAAIILPIGITAFSYSFYWGCRARYRWIAYAAILGVLITAFATYKLGA